MTVPLVIDDVTRMTTSLTDFLRWNGIDVYNNECVHAPMLTHEFIENEATKLIKDKIDYYVSLLEKITPSEKVPSCEIDPYKIAEKRGLKVIRTNLSKDRHLGNFDYRKRLVRLSDSQADGEPRDRFSMGHEIGHDVLHSNQRFHEFMERDAQLSGEAATDIWERHWLDIQANYFASCLLMPRKVVALLYSIYWKKWFKKEQVRPLHISDDYYNDKTFQNVVAPMSRKMNVSMEAMKNTLIDMELIVDDNTF
jgi:Zn-dependent peptidase ImmA (M78 family)